MTHLSVKLSFLGKRFWIPVSQCVYVPTNLLVPDGVDLLCDSRQLDVSLTFHTTSNVQLYAGAFE